MKKRILGCLALAALGFFWHCGNTSPTPGQNEVGAKQQISGTINDLAGSNVNASTRVLVAWNVISGSPDYTYVYGEGSLDLAAKTFSVELPDNPPAEALNSSGLGVGLIIFTNDAQIKVGDKITGSLSIVGGAPAHSVIFIRENATNLATYSDGWPTRFVVGYSVGEGYDVPNTVFDGFRPAANTGVIAQTNLVAHPWVNWY